MPGPHCLAGLVHGLYVYRGIMKVFREYIYTYIYISIYARIA